MSIRKCYVDTCQSSADREQDKGVTFHKLPKNSVLKAKWSIQTRLSPEVDQKWCFVCSRHFRKVDFEPYKASKFVLKSDAIPTIFSWGVTPLEELDKVFSSMDSKILSESIDSNKKEQMEMDSSDRRESADERKRDASGENNIEDVNVNSDALHNANNKSIEPHTKIVTDTDQFETFLKETQESMVAEFNRNDSKNIDSDKSACFSGESDSENKKIHESNGTSADDNIIDSVIHEERIENGSLQNQNSTLPEIESIFENLFEKEKDNSEQLKENSVNLDHTNCDNVLNDDRKQESNLILKGLMTGPSKSIPKQQRKLPAGRPRRRSPFRNKNLNPKTKFAKRKKSRTVNTDSDSNVCPQNDRAMLIPGARVEAKDFNDTWYFARVLEVDQDEDEVLIHYDKWSSRFDEWINISSPRLRLIQGPPPTTSTEPTYAVGERCYARWSNNQRFPATVSKVLQSGKYEVMFDDGFKRTMKWIMMSKGGNRRISSNPPSPSAAISKLSETINETNIPVPPTTPPPPLQNHLFDPKRDHLGTKEERRSMKKRIDVKTLFFNRKKKRELEMDKSIETSPEIKDEVKKKKKPKSPPSDEEESKEKIKKKPGALKGFTKTKQLDLDDTDLTDVPADLSVSNLDSDNITSPQPSDSNVDTLTKLIPPVISSNSQTNPSNTNSTITSPLSTTQSDLSVSRPILSEILSQSPMKLENLQKPDVAPKLLNSPIIPNKLPVPVSVASPKQFSSTLLSEMLRDSSKTILTMKETESGPKLALTSPSPIVAKPPPIDPNQLRAAEKDWCCYWVNSQPVGPLLDTQLSKESSVNRITVQVEDARLPPGWTKLLTRKSVGTAEGKWDVVLVCPSGRRYRTRGEMVERFSENDRDELLPYALGLMDFSAHRKQARRRGWDVTLPTYNNFNHQGESVNNGQLLGNQSNVSSNNLNHDNNFVYIGSLKVQIIENLLRCPKEGCFKNFRRENLLQMHIKHYHPEMCRFFGDTPNVADLAYARTVIEEPPSFPVKPKADYEKSSGKSKDKHKHIVPYIKSEPDTAAIKVEQLDFDNYLYINQDQNTYSMDSETNSYNPTVPVKEEPIAAPEDINTTNIGEEYQMFGQWNLNKQKFNRHNFTTFDSHTKTFTHCKKLTTKVHSDSEEDSVVKQHEQTSSFICAQSFAGNVKKPNKKRPLEGGGDENKSKKKKINSYNSWNYFTPELDETRSSFGVLEKINDSAGNFGAIGEDIKDGIKKEKDSSNQSMIVTEGGERIKIVHMKREEVINCRCGFGEEDGLMIQCELCLCWQHAICHHIERESEVPEKYICDICLNPLRGRRSQKYLHEQDWLYEGKLPRASPTPLPIDATRASLLRKSHELAANLLQLRDFMHSLRCKIQVAEKKDHPKLYLWSTPWDDNTDTKDFKSIQNIKTKELIKMEDIKIETNSMDINRSEPINEDCINRLPNDIVNSDLMASAILDNNLVKEEELKTHTVEDILKDPKLELVNGTNLFGNLLASPGGTTIDLPITNSEIEALTKAVNFVPQPEAAIEPADCRLRLLQHVEKSQLLLEARLDSIEAQIAELEAQDVPINDSETPDQCPRTKQTIQMLLRDLTTLEELGLS